MHHNGLAKERGHQYLKFQIMNTDSKKMDSHAPLGGVGTRTFQFTGMNGKEQFVRTIKAPDRESAIADFELTYPDLTWRFSIDVT